MVQFFHSAFPFMTTTMVSSYLIPFALPIRHTSDRQSLTLDFAGNFADPGRSRAPIQNLPEHSHPMFFPPFSY